MERVRNSDWEEDQDLCKDLKRYVLEGLKRHEVLDFVKRDYPQYAWSLGTLSRRLKHFNISYVDYGISAAEVERAVQEENAGPGNLLGYRAMQKKLRIEHQLAVPRALVYATMTNVDPEGLERRKCVGTKKKKRGPTGTFTSLGPNHTYSGDGHDKLMGFAKDTFPLAVYGMQDVFSGCILYLKVWTSNSNPKLVGRWYLEQLRETKVLSRRLRLDKGSETGTMATIHCFLRSSEPDDGNADGTVIYGPSTRNKIERWWRELHHRLEKYFKLQLRMLLDEGYYDPNDQADRDMLAFVFVPILQREMDIFKDTVWNSHRIRKQKDAQMPKGIPHHLYCFPEKYGAEECGLSLEQEALDEVTELSGVFEVGNDYLNLELREHFERILPEIGDVKSKEAADAYLFLKAHYQESSA